MYSLSPSHTVLSHSPAAVTLLADIQKDLSKEELLVHVRSGDYFILLATVLDAISDELVGKNEAESASLQGIVENLLYLHQNFKLVRK